VTAVLTSGYDHSGFPLVHRILLAAGLAEAALSRREQLSATELQAKLSRAICRPSEGALASLQPSRLWNELAVDLFLSNIDGPVWGWADSGTMPLLDFWREFDEDTRFVLVYSPPEFAIGQALGGKRATKEAVESVTRQWVLHAEAIVRFMKSNQRRCEVVSVIRALGAPAQLVGRLAQRWSIPLQLPADFVLDRTKISRVVASLARGAVDDREDLLALYEEMEVLAGLDGDSSCMDEGLLAWNEYGEEKGAHEAAGLRIAHLEERLAQDELSARELLTTLAESRQQIEHATHELDSYARLLAEHDIEKQAMERQLAADRAELAELRLQSDKLPRLEEQLSEVKRERDQLATERDLGAARIQEVERRFAAAQSELTELLRNSERLRQVEEDLVLSRSQAEQFAQDRDAHVQLLGNCSTQIQHLEQMLGAAQAENAELLRERVLHIHVKEELGRELDQLKTDSVNRLEAARTAAEKANSEQVEKFNELQQENELLLLQLHQVQEELEHYYLQNKELLAKAVGNARLAKFFHDNQPAEVIIDLRGDLDGENWYHAEDDGRWAGPKTTSSIRIPALLPGQYAMEIDVVDAMSAEIVSEMDVFLNGVEISTEVHMQSDYPALVVGRFSTDEIPSETHWCFEFRFANLISPMQRGERDERTLALRARTIALKLEPPGGVR
jgi:hypothetical protein